ncbi:hypothetical protein DEO72_LG8g1886 [Vigna unguiculata]|uniref:Nucleic acid-binding n=1 Tax=Vigna unguiculata TaxID=3917 RepID=A0A4D6MVC7_VIGUN|nr:hypothetical protein DEO72_LG8g1886 [Vigna unguiculata]
MNTASGNLPEEFEVLIDKTYMFKVECNNDYNSKFDQSFRVKKVCMDEKVIESFSDFEVKSLITNEISSNTIAENTASGNLPEEFEVLIDKTYMFKVECNNDYNSKFDQSFRVKKVCMDEKVIESFSDFEVKSLITNEISSNTIAEDLLIKFIEESNDVIL